MGFLLLPDKLSSWNRAKVVIVPAPYEKTTSYGKGTIRGPKAILDASTKLELYDIELGIEPSNLGIHTLPLPAAGKMANPKAMLKYLYTETRRAVETDKLPVILGGEHTVTLGPMQFLSKKYPDLTVLSLDAHTDLRDKYYDSEFSHGCVMKRLLDYVKIVEAGIRSTSLEEQETVRKYKVPVFTAEEILANRNFAEKLLPHLSRDVYVSIDIDVFDPAIIPSTGTPEPGGIGWYDVLAIVKTIAMKRNVVGFDVVELAPMKGNNAPDFLAAKLIYKFIGEIFYSRKSNCKNKAK
jgi:agmatinase